jgi:hypothetical protein
VATLKTPANNAFGDMLDATFKAWKEPDPEARARVAEMLRKFHAGIPVNAAVARHWAKMAPLWASGSPAYVGLTAGTPSPPPKPEAERLADLLAHASDPLIVTPALLKALEAKQKQEEAR